MTREDVIRMAREADPGFEADPDLGESIVGMEAIERFATLVAAAAKAEEREACARECEEVDANPRVVLHHAIVCAAAIRSRSNT
jgi:hypothetical protein